MRTFVFSSGIVALLATLILPASAAQRTEHGRRERHVEQWHGDIHQFHRHDFPVWQGGRWYHGPHGGRDGWWWIVGLNWYRYPAPIYRFDPYLPPPAVAGARCAGCAAALWYYCANQPALSYVPQCYGSWERAMSPR
jgi:hypothetical protein